MAVQEVQVSYEQYMLYMQFAVLESGLETLFWPHQRYYGWVLSLMMGLEYF
jgi:hypothetical protein